MFRRRLLAAAAVAATALLYSGSRADAGFQATLFAGGSSTTIVDGGLGDFDGLANGTIVIVSQVVGGYTFTTTLTETNTPGGPTVAFVNSGTNDVSGTGATTIAILASANGFTSPVTPPSLDAISGATFQVKAATNPGNTFTVSYLATLDSSNSLSNSLTPGGTVIGSGGPDTIGTPSGNADQNDNRLLSSVNAPYALNLLLVAKANNAGQNNIDLDGTLVLQPVPAPGGLVLLGTAVPFLGLLRRRLRRAETSVVQAAA
jgi:hypothetical protein